MQHLIDGEDAQIKVIAEAVHAAYCKEGTEVSNIDKAEAREIVAFINNEGWVVARAEDVVPEHVSEGPIQRALGIQ